MSNKNEDAIGIKNGSKKTVDKHHGSGYSGQRRGQEDWEVSPEPSVI
jgi:hypothetical protein